MTSLREAALEVGAVVRATPEEAAELVALAAGGEAAVLQGAREARAALATGGAGRQRVAGAILALETHVLEARAVGAEAAGQAVRKAYAAGDADDGDDEFAEGASSRDEDTPLNGEVEVAVAKREGILDAIEAARAKARDAGRGAFDQKGKAAADAAAAEVERLEALEATAARELELSLGIRRARR